MDGPTAPPPATAPAPRQRNPHVEESTHACPKCSKIFPTRSALRQHVTRTHAPGRLFVCGVCDRALKSAYRLQHHMLRHTGERPHACSLCPRTYARKDMLLRHTRLVHPEAQTQRPPIECEVCGERFWYRRGLVQHMLKHTNERAFACPHCERAFPRQDTLARHVKSIHEGKRRVPDCCYPNCTAGAYYGVPGHPNEQFCFLHHDPQRHYRLQFGVLCANAKLPEPVCFAHPRALFPHGLCRDCFEAQYPAEAAAYFSKEGGKRRALSSVVRAETTVAKFLHDEFQKQVCDLTLGFGSIAHNKRFNFFKDCSACQSPYRPDVAFVVEGTAVFVEIDERQHRGYNRAVQEVRANDLFFRNPMRQTWIRFNPDSYVDSRQRRVNPPLADRLPRLREVVAAAIAEARGGPVPGLATDDGSPALVRTDPLVPLEVFIYYDGDDYHAGPIKAWPFSACGFGR